MLKSLVKEIKNLIKMFRGEIKNLKKIFKKEIKYIKKLWKKWCKICELYNEDITYGNYEEYTHPTDIVNPLIISTLISIPFIFGGMEFMILGFIISNLILYPMFFLPMLLKVSKKKKLKKI